MNRRETMRMMVGVLAAAGGADAASVFTSARAAPAEEARPPSTTNAAAVDAHLKRDAERLKPRVYSDEGIPMFLACIDRTRTGAAPALTPLNTRLAREIAETGVSWSRLFPDAKVEDASKILEVLAERDFTARTVGASR